MLTVNSTRVEYECEVFTFWSRVRGAVVREVLLFVLFWLSAGFEAVAAMYEAVVR